MKNFLFPRKFLWKIARFKRVRGDAVRQEHETRNADPKNSVLRHSAAVVHQSARFKPIVERERQEQNIIVERSAQ